MFKTHWKKMVYCLLVLGMSSQGMASYLVPAYNENYCPVLNPEIASVVTWTADNSHLYTTQRLIESVALWDSSFKAAGDFRLNMNKSPLCIGLMNDWGAPNAGALGTSFILMGEHLLLNLAIESAGQVELKNITEKFVLAHEYAHYLQNLYMLEFDYVLPMLSTKIKEQHADCMAAYMLRMNNQLNDSLSESLKAFISRLADEHIVGDHGTAEQRILAYSIGSALGRLQSAIGKGVQVTTAQDVIQQCGKTFVPTNLSNL